MRWTVVPAAALVLVLASMGACGGDDGDDSSTGSSGPMGETDAAADDAGPGAMLTVTVNVTGDATLAGEAPFGPLLSGTTTEPMSCAHYAEGESSDGGPRTFQVADLFLDGIAGQDVTIIAGASEYTGPGTYTDGDVSAVYGSDAEIDIGSERFLANPDDPAMTLTVDPDGSGTWSFEHLMGIEAAAGKTIQGRVEWTCADRS